jgi:hypothetical protein
MEIRLYSLEYVKAKRNRVNLKMLAYFILPILLLFSERYNSVILVFLFLIIYHIIDEKYIVIIEKEKNRMISEKNDEIESLEYKITQLERNNNI